MREVQFDYSMEKESARQRSCIQKSKDERRRVESVHGVRAERRVERARNRDKVAGIRDRSGARDRLSTGSVVMWVMREFLWAGEFRGRKHPGRRVRKVEDVFGWDKPWYDMRDSCCGRPGAICRHSLCGRRDDMT